MSAPVDPIGPRLNAPHPAGARTEGGDVDGAKTATPAIGFTNQTGHAEDDGHVTDIDQRDAEDARGVERRFPRSVYSTGGEPDPRFSLANERTFLAWIRTSIGLIAAGVALEALAAPVQPALRLTASVLLIVGGIAAPVQAWLGWAKSERAMRLGRPLPASGLAVPLAVVVIVAGLLVLVGTLLGR